MTDATVPITSGESKTLVRWLFNPFRYVAGGTALGTGLLIIIGTSLIGSFGRTHFDGVLDVHAGTAAPLWVFISEGLIDWLTLSLALTFLAVIIPPRSFRIIDVFGTQALARWPMLLTALATLPPGFARYNEQLIRNAESGNPTLPPFSADAAFYAFGILIMILAIIWMVAMMYQGFSVSCHVKGATGVIAFIVGLLAAEILSKYVLQQILKRFIALGPISGG
jgi:hypothetical protein